MVSRSISFIVIIYSFLFFSGCSEKQTTDFREVSAIKYFYLPCYQSNLKKDTISFEKNKWLSKDQELIAEANFEYLGKNHLIKMYTNDNRSHVDGGSLIYTLDTIGVIYGCSTTWPNYSRLSSTNDSINDLLTTALGYILMNRNLHCYHCSKDETHLNETLNFVHPVIIDAEK